MIAGIDYSTRFIDVVLLDEDTDAAEWHRFELEGADAFERTRGIRFHRAAIRSLCEGSIAVGIENPGGKYGTGAMYRVQGAVLTCIPQQTLVQPLPPAVWRKTVGLPGNATKLAVERFVNVDKRATTDFWPQDACDAYCIALATRTLLHHGAAA